MQRQEPVSEIMRRALGEFPQAERKVARTLLAGALTMGLESSSKVASHAGVSGPTVIRFVNRLGFPTYAAFQGAVQEELEMRFASPIDLFPVLPVGDAGTDAGRHAAEGYSSAIAETFGRLSAKELAAAVDILGNNRLRVVVFGGWFSHVLARHLVGLLQEVRQNVQFVGNAAQHRVPALVDAGSHTAAVFFDYRRYESDTNDIGRAMAAKGAKVILFTDKWISPLADKADVVLTASVGEPRPFESYVAPLALVETVVAAVVEANLDGIRGRFEYFNGAAAALAGDTRGSQAPSATQVSGARDSE